MLVSDLFTLALHIASGMKAPASGASLATAAPAAEETPKAAVPDIGTSLCDHFVVTVMLS